MATRSKTKTQARQASADKRPKAIAKYVRISPRKVKIVIDLIRGKNVDEAAAILTYTPKAASPVVLKVLNSAIANAVNNQELDRKELYVAEVYANPAVFTSQLTESEKEHLLALLAEKAPKCKHHRA